MKKQLLTMLMMLALSIPVTALATGCGGGNNDGDSQSSEQVSPGTSEEPGVTPTAYAVKFVDADGNVLQESDVEIGQTPQFTGSMPQLPADTAEYKYSWKWDKEIVAVTEATTYTLELVSTKQMYTVKFVDEDGNELQVSTLQYGETPTAPTASVPADTAEYKYSGAWDKEIASVTGDVTYTWKVTSEKQTYTVKFVDEDGNELQVSTLQYGETPTAPTASVPADTAEYKYSGAWDKEITSVTGDATYTWKVTSEKQEYTVKFVDEDGNELQVSTLQYGETPTAPTASVPADTAEYKYSGAWDKEIASVTGDATYTWKVTSEKQTYTVTFDGENATTVEYGATVSSAPQVSVQGAVLDYWTVNGEKVDLTTYTITGETAFVSVTKAVPYATSADNGYMNAAASEELGEGSWYYDIGSQATPCTWTVTLPLTAYAKDTATTYAWKYGDWSSIGFVENDWIAGGGTVREGTITVTNIEGSLLVEIYEPTLDITKSTTITDADVVNGEKPVTVLVNNGAQYRHFYLGKGVVSESKFDTFVIDSNGNKYPATKTTNGANYTVKSSYGENGLLTIPKINYSEYTKVSFDWSIAGGWTFLGLERENRFYEQGNATGGSVTILNKGEGTLSATITQTVTSSNSTSFSMEITDENIINGTNSLTLSYYVMSTWMDQTIAISNIQTSTEELPEEETPETGETPVEFTPQAVGDDGKVITATESSVIEGGLCYDIGNGGTGRTCDVTFAVVDYSKYTTVTYQYKGSADWMSIGFTNNDKIAGNGDFIIEGTITVTNDNGTYTAVITDNSGSSKTMTVTDTDVINGKAALTIVVYGGAYRAFNISAPTCA